MMFSFVLQAGLFVSFFEKLLILFLCVCLSMSLSFLCFILSEFSFMSFISTSLKVFLYIPINLLSL